MFKKTSIIVLALFFAVFVSGIAGIGVYAENPANVIDNLDYLSTSEIANLQADIDNIKNGYGLDVVIVITDNTEGKSSRDFADDFFDYNGYGIGSDYSGLLMLINMQNREVWISTTGKAIDIFTDSRISKMVDNVISPLSDAKYYNACRTFIRDVQNYANAGVPHGQYRVPTDMTYADKVSRMVKSFPVYIIALVVSIGATLILSFSSKGKVTINHKTYEEDGSFELSERRDDYIRESTVRTKIADSSSGGGGRSSTHRGSSGRSHGGGGGRF